VHALVTVSDGYRKRIKSYRKGSYRKRIFVVTVSDGYRKGSYRDCNGSYRKRIFVVTVNVVLP